MVSITKIGMSALFSSMALAQGFGAVLDAKLAALDKAIELLQKGQVTQNAAIHALEDDVDEIMDQQITGDYYY